MHEYLQKAISSLEEALDHLNQGKMISPGGWRLDTCFQDCLDLHRKCEGTLEWLKDSPQLKGPCES